MKLWHCTYSCMLNHEKYHPLCFTTQPIGRQQITRSLKERSSTEPHDTFQARNLNTKVVHAIYHLGMFLRWRKVITLFDSKHDWFICYSFDIHLRMECQSHRNVLEPGMWLPDFKNPAIIRIPSRSWLNATAFFCTQNTSVKVIYLLLNIWDNYVKIVTFKRHVTIQ